MPLRLGDANPTVDLWRHVMNARFGGLYTRLHGALPTDTDKFGPQAATWQKEYEFRTGQPIDGVVSDGDLAYLGITVPALPGAVTNHTCVMFSVGGAGSAWNNGYQWDLGEAMDKRAYHQPIGFNTNPLPMQKGVDDGVAELIRQLDRPRVEFGGRNCTQIPWGVCLAYSMGSLVWMTVLMRVLYGDLKRFKPMYMGSNSFGNPARQENHAFPGAIAVPGEGIARASVGTHDVPDCHWDFTAIKGMVGSPGVDLYADIDGSEFTRADMRAVWELVRTGNPLSLAATALKLAASPSFSGGYAAAEAALHALDFFVVKSLTPHTSYQFVQPIAGDPRDCWRIALDHSNDIIARLPIGAAGT